MSIEVADLVASLGMDARRFDSGMILAEARAKSGAAAMGLAFAGIGLAATAGLVGSLKAATDYQTMIQNIQSNTTLTDAQVQVMSSGIQALAAQTGAPLDQLAHGFMHISNFGFSAADSMKVLKPAMESALSTGDDVASVAEVLAKNMHEFHIKTADAANAMNVLHYAAALGNATLGDFVHSTTTALNVASGLGVSFVDVTAALSTMTRAGQSAQQANRGVSSTMQNIIGPIAGARTALAELTKVTGINLVRDFSAAGLRARGLAGVLQDTHRAILQTTGSTAAQQRTLAAYGEQLRAHHTSAAAYQRDMAAMARSLQDPTQMLRTIFSNQVAFREVMQLTGNQARDYTQTIKTLSDTFAGKLNPTQAGFARQQATLAAQWAKFTVNAQELGIAVGTALLPPMTSLSAAIMPLVQGFTSWARAHKELTAGFLAAAAAIGLLGGAAVFLTPLAAAIAALGAPLLAVGAASAGLALAWSHDWGGIREKVAAAWGVVQPILRGLQTEFLVLRELFKIGGFGLVWTVLQSQLKDLATAFVAWVPGAAAALTARLGALAGQIVAWIRSVGAPALVTHLQTWADAFWGWVQQAWPPLLREAGVLGGRLWGWITGTAAPSLGAHLRTWGTAFWAWVQPATAALLSHIPAMLDRLGAWANSAAHTLEQNFSPWVAAAWHWVRQAGPPLARELAKLLTEAVVAIVALSPRFISAFTTLTVDLGQWAATTALPEFLGFGLDMGTALVQGVLDAFVELGPRITAALGALVQQAINKIPGAGGALNMLGTAGNALGGVNSLTSLVNGWMSLPRLMPDQIPGLFPRQPSNAAVASQLLSLGSFGFRNTATPLISGPPASARGGAGPGPRVPSIVNVNITRSGTSVSGGTVDEQAMGRHVGKAADAALLELEEALRRGGPSAQRLLAGTR